MLTLLSLAAAMALSPSPSLLPLQGNDGAEDSVWDRLSFYANGRLRAESTFDQPDGADDRHRGRLRFRAGAKYRIEEGLTAEARISTASSSPNNAHWDFGDGFGPAELRLDRFFVAWEPSGTWQLRAGKMPHAFVGPPVYEEWAWDADIQPAGLAAIWSPDLGGAGKEGLRADVRAVAYIAVENSQEADAKVGGVQGNLHVPVGDGAELHLSTSYLDWSSLTAGDGFAVQAKGNTAGMGGMNLWEGFAAISTPRGPLGTTQAYVELLRNVDAEDDEDSGMALGVRLGESGRRGDVNVFGAWVRMDANAILGPMGQDDLPIDGTGRGDGMTGMLAGMQYQWRDHVAFKLWALTSDADLDADPFRVRLDLDFTVK